MKVKSQQVSESEDDVDDPSEEIEDSDVDEICDSEDESVNNKLDSSNKNIESPKALNTSLQQDKSNLSSNKKDLSKKLNSSTIDKFLKKKNSVQKTTFCLEDITEDDDVYTFQCPKDFNLKDLIGRSIDVSESSKLSIENDLLFLDVLKTDKKFLTLAFPKKTQGGCLVNLPLKGHILIHKDVKISQCISENGGKKDIDDRILFPNDIKIRHPLLGTDWKSHMKLAEKSIQKQELIRKKNKKEKKEKQKRKEKGQSVKREFSFEDSSPKPKKKKKMNQE